jgi:tripeptidyl-peptidase I
MGPESGGEEIACQSQLGGVITTGGGFSTFFPTPSWQADAVSDYFSRLTSSEYPSSGYNEKGRAYPDVSIIGVWYPVVIQGELTPLFGTSASSPVMAAMVSLANAARADQNLGPLGYLNPTLYSSNSRSLFNDVDSGINNCIAYGDLDHPEDAVCCNSGFAATSGWDPVTGWGSVDYTSLVTMFDPNYVASDDDGGSNGLSDGAVAGVVIGSIAGFGLIAGGAYYFLFAAKA